MMNKKAITVSNLSKKYRNRSAWAINDLSFSLESGKALGLIGNNGAGKTTLLKLLAGILTPTNGDVYLVDKPQALIDISTGFFPEFTGKENIAFNYRFFKQQKSISYQEYEKMVMAFADLGPAIHDPIFSYSSGMFTRLAFSVITHLPSKIILVDELIVAGDASFKNKVKSKLQELKSNGTSFVISSHNLNELSLICDEFMILEKGILKSLSNDLSEVKRYAITEVELDPALINKNKETEHVSILNIDSNKLQKICPTDQSQTIKLNLKIDKKESPINLAIRVNSFNNEAFVTTPLFFSEAHMFHESGEFEVGVTFPENFLNEGKFSLDLIVIENLKKIGEIKDFFQFRMELPKRLREKEISLSLGAVKPDLNWTIKRR